MPAPDTPVQLPDDCDLGVITVIGEELRQVLKAFEIPKKRGRQHGSCYYWETTVYSQELQRPLKVVIGCIAQAGVVNAAIRTSAFLQLYRPTMMLLVGIAAGWRTKLRIGHVVWPRHVLAVASIEVQENQYVFRPDQHKPAAAVLQMLQWWKVNPAELATHTDRILAGETVSGRDRTDARGPEVLHSPQAEEAVIGCGDFLLRHDSHFIKLHAIDQQVRACEMESAGMVLALRDAAPLTPWLQVRGISDFGDSQKHDGWQPYAAAAAGAFARLFAEQCFDPDLILGKKQATPVMPRPTEPTAEPRSVATAIPAEVVETAPAATASTIGEFDQIREAWKKGRGANTVEKLQALRQTQAFQAATLETRAKILRFEAKVTLDILRDVAAAEELALQANNLTGAHRATEAMLAAQRESPEAAAKILDGPKTLEEWNQRMGYLLQAKRADAMLHEWDIPPEGVGPDVESYRLRVYALLMKKKLPEARVAFEKIGAKHREGFAIRLLGAVLDYHQAISPAAPDPAFHLVPLAVPAGFVKRDEESLAALERAEQGFVEVLKDVQEKNEFHYELQGWRLGAAAMNTRRRSEAEELCRQLLEEAPTNMLFLGWANACGFQFNRNQHKDALAAELGVKL